jgi:hypothetical protein
MEGGEADVREFFLAERGELAGREVRPLLKLAWRHRGRHRASGQRKSESGETERRYCGFGHSLLFRSLLRPLHGRILRGWKYDLRGMILRLANRASKIHAYTNVLGSFRCIHLHERHRGNFLSLIPNCSHDAVRNRLPARTGKLAWSINSDASLGMSF